MVFKAVEAVQGEIVRGNGPLLGTTLYEAPEDFPAMCARSKWRQPPLRETIIRDWETERTMLQKKALWQYID